MNNSKTEGTLHKSHQETSKKVDYKSKNFVCGLCVAVFKSKAEQVNHNASASHRMVLSQTSNRKSIDICKLCNVIVKGARNYLNHIKGRKHVNLVRSSVKRNISEESAVSQQTTRTQCQPINVSVGNTPCVTEADKNIHDICFDDRLPFNDHAVLSNNDFLPLNTTDMQERHTMEKNKPYRGNYYDRGSYQWYPNSYCGYNEPPAFYTPLRRPWQSNRYFSRDRYGRLDSSFSHGRNLGEVKDQSPLQFLKHSKDNRHSTEMGCRSRNSHAKDKSDSGKNSASSKCSIEKAENNQDKTKNKIANLSKEETNSKVFNEISSTTDIVHEKNTNSSLASTSADVSGQLGAKLVSARVKSVINSEKVLSPVQTQHLASSSTDIRPLNIPGRNLPRSRSVSIESGDNKLEKWSKELQNMWPNMKSCDTDIINHMVHFPSTNKDRAALKFLIKEHSKSKKKLSYPRFNLPLPDSSVSKSLGEGYESMEKAVSNAVNVLPDNILNSLVCALDSDREDQCVTSPKKVTTNQINDGMDLFLPQIITTPVANKKRCRSKLDMPKKVRNSKKAKVVSEKINILGSKLGEVPKSAEKVDDINSEMENLLTDFLSSEKQTPLERGSNAEGEFDITKVKHEVVEVETESLAPMPSTNISQLPSEPGDGNPSCVTSPSFSGEGLDIDSLMDLFAKGGVKVKSEFEDPVIEAMKSFGANVWEQVSSSTPSQPHTLTSPAAAKGSPTSQQPTPELDKEKSPLPSAFKSNIKELVEMNKEEEQLHKELQEAEHEICHLQEMLNNWKAKKNEIQQKEIALRTKRQLLLEQLQGEFTEDPAKNPPAPQHVNNIPPNRSDALHTTPHLSNTLQKRSDILQTNFERSHVTSTTSKSKTAKSDQFLFSFQLENTSPLIDVEDSPDESKGQEHETEENSISNELCVSLEGLLQAHSSAITCIEIFEGFMYTSSSDATSKRFSLKNPSEIVEYKGHTKSITGLCVFRTKVRDEASKKKKVCLFTSCYDGYLRSYLAESGIRVWTVDLQCTILCMCKGWGKLFLGLQNGNVAIITNGEVERSLQCATASIGRLTTASQGALRLLCAVGYDGVATIWDTKTGLLLRCLEGRVKPPSYAQVCDNNIYLSSTEKSLLIQDISSGKLQRMLNWPASATGLAVCNHYIISSSYDGVIRCYDINKDFALHSMYYGAGNECIMCMTVCDNWIFTGNRKGLIEAVKFDPKVLEPCQFGRCHFKFGRRRDLAYHAALEHVRHMDKYCKACPWRECTFSFTGALTSKAKERHITGHLLHD